MIEPVEDLVILVDEQDRQIGTAGKMEAHYLGMLHRAFSVFIFTRDGRLLLQQRAAHKYHSGGKWTNTCCSHPRPGENTLDAAIRRLGEEMGLNCTVIPIFSFTYQAGMEQGLTEHEFDHVYFGISDKLPVPNPEEVSNYSYMEMDELDLAMKANPGDYTEWLKISFDRVKKAYAKVFRTSIQNDLTPQR